MNNCSLVKIGETRGKFVSQLQKVHKEHKTVEEDLKADAAAWNELMYVHSLIRKLSHVGTPP